MRYVVYDTDAMSLSFKGRLPAVLKAKTANTLTAVTFVTYGELVQWAAVRDWAPARLHELMRHLRNVPVLDADVDVARTWGEINARARKRGRPRPQNDSWIAACCLVYGLPLVTRNLKDFRDFADHEQLALVTE